jgi:hypothetical protein
MREHDPLAVPERLPRYILPAVAVTLRWHRSLPCRATLYPAPLPLSVSGRPRTARGRIAALNRLPRHDARDPIVRDVVRQRAADAWEYRLMPTTGKFEIEHIIPKQRWNDHAALCNGKRRIM